MNDIKERTRLQYEILNEALQKPIIGIGAAAKYLGMSRTTLLTDTTLAKKHIGKKTCVTLISLAAWLTARS